MLVDSTYFNIHSFFTHRDYRDIKINLKNNGGYKKLRSILNNSKVLNNIWDEMYTKDNKITLGEFKKRIFSTDFYIINQYSI